MDRAHSESALHGVEHLRKIILQLLTSLDGHDSPLGHDMQRVYMHLYRAVVDAQLSGNTHEMFDVIRVLEFERDTWQQLEQRWVRESAQRNSRLTDDTNAAPAIGSAHSIGLALCLEA